MDVGPVQNYSNILMQGAQQQGAQRQERTNRIVGAGRGIGQKIGEEHKKSMMANLLVKEGMDPSRAEALVEMGPTATIQGMQQFAQEKGLQQRQGASFEHAEKMQGMPTYSDKQQDEQSKAFGEAFQPQTQVPFLEPEEPSTDDAMRRYFASGKADPRHAASMLGAAQRPEIAMMQEQGKTQRAEAGLGLQRDKLDALTQYRDRVLALKQQGLDDNSAHRQAMVDLGHSRIESQEREGGLNRGVRTSEGALNRQSAEGIASANRASREQIASAALAQARAALAGKITEADEAALELLQEQIGLVTYTNPEQAQALSEQAWSIINKYKEPRMGAVGPAGPAPSSGGQAPAPPGWVRGPDGKLRKQ